MLSHVITDSLVETPPRKVIALGVRAGLTGGLLMAVFAMIYTAATGSGVWLPLQLIGASFSGVDAAGGDGVVIAGALLHLFTSAVLGVAFAVFPARDRRGSSAFLAGIGYGLAAFVLMTFVVLPSVDSTMLSRIAMMPAMWLAAHVLFGMGVGAVLALHKPSARAADAASLSRRSATVGRRLPASS